MVLLWETETSEAGWIALEQYLSPFDFSTVEKNTTCEALNISWLFSQKGQ